MAYKRKDSIKIVWLIFSLPLLLFSFQQAEPLLLTQLSTLLAQYNKSHAQEKVYVQLDKPFYAAGEDIWYKAYLVNASTHAPDSVSRNIYVELIDESGKVTYKNILKVKAGSAIGDFDTSDSLEAGTYTIRAYTNWMRNFPDDYFFSKEIEIYNDKSFISSTAIDKKNIKNVSNKSAIKTTAANKTQANSSTPALPDVSIQFFPESGSLISDIESKVAFKAINPLGKAETISGIIVDNTGAEVASFSSAHAGMGTFSLLPAIGKTYTAKIKTKYAAAPIAVALPQVQQKGAVLSVNNLLNDNIRVAIQQNIASVESPRDLVLVGQVRGQLLFAATLSANKPLAAVSIPRSKFPSGIVQLTLFDVLTKEPLCERLCFNQRNDELQISIKTNKTSYQKREKVELEITALDAAWQPVQAEFSLSVIDASLQAEPYQQNILSYLLLSSDLRGHIQQPAYYFKDDSISTRVALDNLLLTQGWRRFIWKELLTNKPPEIKYSTERGITVAGQINRIGTSKPAADSKVIVSVLGKEQELIQTKTTNEGRFYVGDLSFYGTTDVLVQGENQKGKPFVTIALDELKPPAAPAILQIDWKPPVVEKKERPEVAAFIKKTREKNKYDEALELSKNGGRLLQTVNVNANKLRDVQLLQTGRKIDRYVPIDKEMAKARNVITAIFTKVPGLQLNIDSEKVGDPIENDGNIYTLRMGTFKGEPSFYINGWLSNMATAMILNPEDIEAVEVLREKHPAVYRSDFGAINIILKKGATGYSHRREGIIDIKLQGYYKAREFYAPVYDVKKEEHNLPDKRTTLYWNPTVKTDATGKAKISFYNADEVSGFKITAEGISNTGLVGSKTILIGN